MVTLTHRGDYVEIVTEKQRCLVHRSQLVLAEAPEAGAVVIGFSSGAHPVEVFPRAGESISALYDRLSEDLSGMKRQ